MAGLASLVFGSESRALNGYYRSPSVHGQHVVFTAEGDLWRVALSGGVAQRLTTHAAEESEGAISLDGKWIAFCASYDAGRQIYVMPMGGGEPRRVTFETGRVWVQGWTKAGEVIYVTDNVPGPTGGRLIRIVDPESLRQRELPLATANEASLDEAGGRVFFVRYGLHTSNDNARLYRGGAMAQLWSFTLGSPAEAIRLAAGVNANLRRPMWWNGRLYFVSDEDGTANLWVMNADGGSRTQLTTHRGWDVRGASLGDGRIVYQLGADLRVYEIASGRDQALAITLVSDFDQRRPRMIKEPLKFMTHLDFAPLGDRVAVTARGQIALAGVGEIRRIPVAVPEGSRARNAVVSTDGKAIYAIADTTGVNEIWQYPSDGSSGGRALTSDGTIHRWELFLSPDGKKLAHTDKNGALWILNLATGNNEKVETAPFGGDEPYGAVVWSRDNDTLALARPDSKRQLRQIVLHSLSARRTVTLTSDKYESSSPTFTPDGKWLYFLSNRHFQSSVPSPWGDRNTGAHFDRRTKVYALSLQPDLRFPFLPDNEVAATPTAQDKSGDPAKSEKATRGEAPPAIVWEGLADRLHEVPLEPGNYSGLSTDGKRLYLRSRVSQPEPKTTLLTLAIDAKAPKPEVFADDIQQYSLSNDGKKLFFARRGRDGPGAMYIVEAGAKAPADLAKSTVRLSDWTVMVTPKQEWRQMFQDAWRMHRDYSFDANMRGQDWNAVRAKYESLIDRVTDRLELDDVLAQMSSEIGILHSQVRGGEYRTDAAAFTGSALGAEYAFTGEQVRIAAIYATEKELPGARSPLAQPGVNAQPGDVILAVNGRPIRNPGDLARALERQAGQQVLLELKRGEAEPHRTVVKPVDYAADATFRYRAWTEATRGRVAEVGKGQIGYLHLRAMGTEDMANFVREFYANYDRDGLILDVRRNRGGNIDSWVIEKLLRRAWAFWDSPRGEPRWNMQQTFRGHLVVLIDEMTYSDGETFAAGVKTLGLGPLIGKRTSGAGIWLSDGNRLVDGGQARIAETGQFGPDGRWLIEGHGVEPDIEVDNPPQATYRGGDAQLQAALDHLAAKLNQSPVRPPVSRPIPAVGVPGSDPVKAR